MFCSKCGASVQEGTKFCNSCGNPINGSDKGFSNNAVWESTSVQVSPSEENSTIEEYEWFGWELKSSQTIDRKNSHLEGGYNAVYSVTESVNYVKLVFKRNKDMPNYDEIKQLEDTYRTTFTREMPKNPSILWIIAALFFVVSSLMSAISTGAILSSLMTVIGGLIIATPLIVIYVKKKKEYKNKYDEYIKCNEEASLRKYETLRRLEELRGISCVI